MKVLIACERSGKVKNALLSRGIEAWSCDLEDAYTDSAINHMQCNVFDIINNGWDLMICHPPCTFLCAAASGWIDAERTENRLKAIAFAERLWKSNIPRIALENPKGILNHFIGKWTQKIQPWEYGHGETKETYLWLKNLPMLKPTNILPKVGPNGEDWREQRIWKMAKSETRSRDRSETYQGIADAMAEQWGSL